MIIRFYACDCNVKLVNLFTFYLQFAEGQAGSPVDMAKSYMRARPLWSSPSPAHIETTTPSPSGVQLFKEDTPYSFGRNSLSSSKVFHFFLSLLFCFLLFY